MIGLNIVQVGDNMDDKDKLMHNLSKEFNEGLNDITEIIIGTTTLTAIYIIIRYILFGRLKGF